MVGPLNDRVRVDRPHVLTEWPDHSLWLNGSLDATYRDALGRRNNGRTYAWLILECWQDACPASVLLRADYLETLALTTAADLGLELGPTTPTRRTR